MSWKPWERLGPARGQVNSIEEADRKIDELAAGGMLSPALLLTMAKAYAGVKETDLTKEEVKDIMAHLYFKARPLGVLGFFPSGRILSSHWPGL